jgi:CRP-like cAMP-binding protein
MRLMRDFDSFSFGGSAASLSPANDGALISNPLIRKLEQFTELRSHEREALVSVLHSVRSVPAGQEMVREGSAPEHVWIMLTGFACRYKYLPGGRRQVFGFLIPGDLCDLQYVHFSRTDCGVIALCKSDVVRLPMTMFVRLIETCPGIAHALSLAAMVDSAILREWLLSVGQRDALQRICHLMCEMAIRSSAVGLSAKDGSFAWPINQSALADATGLTVVHVNRTLQRLRAEGLINLKQRRLTILDWSKLAAIAEFDASYLQLRR